MKFPGTGRHSAFFRKMALWRVFAVGGLFLAGNFCGGRVLAAAAKPLLVCAEPVWCAVAREIGGEDWDYVPLLAARKNPHVSALNPSMGRKIARASLIILNGESYDGVMGRLAESHADRIFTAADYDPWQGRSLFSGQDPHLFLDPEVLAIAVPVLTARMAAVESETGESRRRTGERGGRLEKKLQAMLADLKFLREQGNLPVAMTELAGLRLLREAGFEVIDRGLAFENMNGAGLSAKKQAELQQKIKSRKIVALVVNPAVSAPWQNLVRDLAAGNHIPVLSWSENLPENLSWVQWMNQRIAELSALKKAAGSRARN